MNTVVMKIADFLKNHPPFDNLSIDELSNIAVNCHVLNLEKNKILFQIDDILHDCFYVVASGSVNLSVISDAEERLLNRCGVGEVFGLRPFFAKNNYMMTSKAREESIIFAIPIDIFRPFVANNTHVLNFLLESFAATSPNPNDVDNKKGKLVADTIYYGEQNNDFQYFQTLKYNKFPLKIDATCTNKSIAQLLYEKQTNAAVVTHNDIPLGLITYQNLSNHVVTGLSPRTASVSEIMQKDFVSVLENVSLSEAQLLMIKHEVNHLVVTVDGSANSPLRGIIAEQDLIIAQASNPGVLLKEIKRAQNDVELKQLRFRIRDIILNSMNKNLPITHILNNTSELNMALNKRAVELAIAACGSPPTAFAWISLGSQARKEQLLNTDLDSMLVFDDVNDKDYRATKDYFLNMAKKCSEILQNIGFLPCTNGHFASNMLWCKSITDWKKQYHNWMHATTENSHDLSPIFFDLELVYGDVKFETELNKNVAKNCIKNPMIFDFLGNETLRNHAALTFFKKLILEESGINEGMFDIKNRAIMPLVDSARLLCLSFGCNTSVNTYLRFKQLAIEDTKNAEIYLECAEAFLILHRIRTSEGLKNDNSGQFINPKDLSKNDKERLKNALSPMNDMEELIKSRFQLTQFS